MNAIGKIIGSAIILLGLVACSSQNAFLPMGESRLEQNWGRAYETAKHNQIINPEAGKNVDPVKGMDGDAAERVMQTYKSGGEPKQAPPTEFGVVTIKR
jgi:hypothetical protein